MMASTADDRMDDLAYADALSQASRHQFAETRAVPSPQAILVAGVPAHGKCELKATAVSELRTCGCVVIDPCDMFEYHPGFVRMVTEDRSTATTRAWPDAVRLADDLRRQAMSLKRNIVLDELTADGDKAEALCRELRAAGYTIDIRVWAPSG